MKINHIGIIVKNIQQSLSVYMALGYNMTGCVVKDENQNNNIIVLKSKYDHSIELIEPMNELSSVYNFKEGYHHICFEAEPGEDIIHKFKSMKIGKIFTHPIVAPALDNRKVVFACLRNGTFIEFIL